MELSTGSSVGGDTWQLSARDLHYAWIAPPEGFVGSADLIAELRMSNDKIADRKAIHLEWIMPLDLARLKGAPIAIAAVKRIDELFTIEREINGLTPQRRFTIRHERSRPLVAELEAWLREQRARVSNNSETGKAINYSLKRWSALTRFLDDGRLCLSNNAAEREIRAVAMGQELDLRRFR
jgi:Transposase IS66 family